HALAYDSARKRVVLFGGHSATSVNLSDTWEWDGVMWTQRATSSSPSPRFDHATAYDSVRGCIVLFGGQDGSTLFGDTWEWNGSGWLQRTPAATPSARYGHALAYSAQSGSVVMFGGQDTTSWRIQLSDTWEWNGNTWLARSPAISPTGRRYHGMT